MKSIKLLSLKKNWLFINRVFGARVFNFECKITDNEYFMKYLHIDFKHLNIPCLWKNWNFYCAFVQRFLLGFV